MLLEQAAGMCDQHRSAEYWDGARSLWNWQLYYCWQNSSNVELVVSVQHALVFTATLRAALTYLSLLLSNLTSADHHWVPC